MMKWQPAAERVTDTDGTYNYMYLFDKIRQLDAERKVSNVQRDSLFQHADRFIDEVLIIAT